MKPGTQSHTLLAVMGRDGKISPRDMRAVGLGARSRMTELIQMGCAEIAYVITDAGHRLLEKLDRAAQEPRPARRPPPVKEIAALPPIDTSPFAEQSRKALEFAAGVLDANK